MQAKWIVLGVVGFVVVTSVIAHLWLNSHAALLVFKFVPESLVTALDASLAPIRPVEAHDKEEQLEFALFWLLSAVPVGAVVAATTLLRKRHAAGKS